MSDFIAVIKDVGGYGIIGLAIVIALVYNAFFKNGGNGGKGNNNSAS